LEDRPKQAVIQQEQRQQDFKREQEQMQQLMKQMIEQRKINKAKSSHRIKAMLSKKQNNSNELPQFTPIIKYETFLINRTTDLHLLHNLIYRAQQTKTFTIDTESDLSTNRPSLIQIEYIDQYQSVIILVEVSRLPFHKKSLRFWLIYSIFKYIFQPNKKIFCWGSALKELSQFIEYDLFTSEILDQSIFINLQDRFKIWHYEQYGYYQTGKNLWGLQAAIKDTYEQYLDKSERLNIWSRGLHHREITKTENKIQTMIEYATNDCLAVTKLAYTMKEFLFDI
ncbi:unnamed protein product, partial [Rotaria sp. Silwood2]